LGRVIRVHKRHSSNEKIQRTLLATKRQKKDGRRSKTYAEETCDEIRRILEVAISSYNNKLPRDRGVWGSPETSGRPETTYGAKKTKGPVVETSAAQTGTNLRAPSLGARGRKDTWEANSRKQRHPAHQKIKKPKRANARHKKGRSALKTGGWSPIFS